MSQRSHRKRKEDTWTKEELSSALYSKEEKSRHKAQHNSTEERGQRSRIEKPRERKSKYQDLEKLLNEHEESQHRTLSHEQSIEQEKKRERSKKEHTREDENRKLKRRKEKEQERSNELSSITTRDNQEKRKERETRQKENERDIRTTGDYQDKRKERERRHKDNEEIRHKKSHVDENNDLGLKERKRLEKSEKKSRHGESERENRHRDKPGRKQRMEDNETEKEKRRKHKEEKKRLEVHESRNLKHKRSTYIDKAEFTARETNGTTHGGRTTTSTASSESSKVLEDEGKEMYNYDDEEFENYEDDFEEVDDEDDDNHQRNPFHDNNSEMSEIIRAINEENERIASARTSSARSQLKQSTPSEDQDSEQSSVSNLFTTNINFSSAKDNRQNSRIQKKMLKRHQDLSSLIQLDFVSLDCFELTPVTEYNFYIKSFGTQNSRQVSSQCNDDAQHVEVQTDMPEIAEKWSQKPQDGSSSSGGTHPGNTSDTATRLSVSMNQDVQSLAIFMEYAQNLMDASFLEASLWSGSQQGCQSSLSFCDSCSKLNTNISYLQGREILTCSFGVDLLAVAFSAAKQQFSARIDRKYLIAIWKITDTENPYRVLVCDSIPTSCCFAVASKNIFFVATEDGCILAYDLKEPGTMHQRVQLEKRQLNVLRSPTYTTGCRGDAHSSPVIKLSPLSQDDSTDQIFSLEENSRLCIWLVVDVLSDADDDLGLVPQGQVKLVKSMTLDVPGTNRTTCAYCPDAKTFYVGNDCGDIVSLTREKKQNIYSSNCPGDVTCVAFSRICGGFFLTSHQGGSVCLFMTKQDHPLMSWSLDCDRVLSCDWSNRRSSVFFALDSSNQMHVWDLMAVDSAPVATSSLAKRSVGFCADKRSSGSSHLLIAYESSEVEVHRISTHFTDSVTSDEEDNMTSSILFFV